MSNNPLYWVDAFGLDSMYPTVEQMNANSVNNAPPNMSLLGDGLGGVHAVSTGGDDVLGINGLFSDFLPAGNAAGLLMAPGVSHTFTYTNFSAFDWALAPENGPVGTINRGYSGPNLSSITAGSWTESISSGGIVPVALGGSEDRGRIGNKWS